MEELRVIQKNGSIECNFSEIKADLQNMMSAYTSLEITEEGTKEAKSDLATLRKIRKAVDDKRKDVKKSFMLPYTEFENEVKDLLSVIDEPINMIDGKLKEFEVQRVAAKKEHLMQLYKENIGELEEYLPYPSVENPKWTNATYSDKDIIFDISQAKTKVKSDLDGIAALNSEIHEELLKVYKASGNMLSAAIVKNSDYLQAKAAAEKKIREEVKEEVREELKEEPKQILVDTETGEIIPDFTFRVSGNENIQKVKDFLDFSEILYVEV